MPWSGVIPLILVLTLIAVIRFIVTPRRIARLFKQQKDLSAPFVIELTDETSSSHNEFGEGCLPWGTFVKWEENEKLLLLYRSDVLFHMLPKRL